MIEANRNRKELLERFWSLNPSPKKYPGVPRMERGGRGALSEDMVIEIRIRHERGETYKSIAEDYPVCAQNIRRACIGENYRWVR